MRFQDLAKRIKIFHAMNEEQITKIEPHLKELKFKQGDWIFVEGSDALGMYIIRSGDTEIWKTADHQRKGFCLGGLTAGDCFGEMGLVDCQNRSASVFSKTDVSVLYLPYEAMVELYEDDARLFGLLMLNIAREISRRLRSIDRSFVEFALPSRPQS